MNDRPFSLNHEFTPVNINLSRYRDNQTRNETIQIQPGETESQTADVILVVWSGSRHSAPVAVIDPIAQGAADGSTSRFAT